MEGSVVVDGGTPVIGVTPARFARLGRREWRRVHHAGVLLLGLARVGAAFAGEAPFAGAGAPSPPPAASGTPHVGAVVAADAIPERFRMRLARPGTAEFEDLSRRRGTTDATRTATPVGDAGPLLARTTIWQDLAQCRSSDHRVRLITLWEGGDSTVSLQAGRHGNPSLQWTSRQMNLHGATRGLFDGWLANLRRPRPAPR